MWNRNWKEPLQNERKIGLNISEYKTKGNRIIENAQLRYSNTVVMSKPPKIFGNSFPVNYIISGTIVAHLLDRLDGKFIGFIVLNQ